MPSLRSRRAAANAMVRTFLILAVIFSAAVIQMIVAVYLDQPGYIVPFEQRGP